VKTNAEDCGVPAPWTRHWARHWTRQDFTALAICVVVALLLSLAPHLATLARHGTWEYVADADEAYYLSITRIPFQGESALRDHAAGKWENVPSLFPWLPFGPTGQLNRWLGLPLLASSVEWRLAGGLLLGGMLFLFFRLLFFQTRRPAGWALGCTLICLADAGFVQGAIILKSCALLMYWLHGAIPFTKPDALPQYRVISPLLMLPWLLLVAAALLPPAIGKWKWALAGILGLGMCCNLYFFMWTAAVLALGGYIAATWISSWMQPECRAGAIRATRHAAIILAGGLVLGAPQIHQTYNLSRQPRLQPMLARTCRAQYLAAPDPYRRMNLINFWVWGKLLAGGIAILWFRVRGLGFLWCLVFAGYLLSNIAIVFGIEFENWHWVFVHAPMGEILILASCAILLDRIRVGPRQLWAFPAALLAIACIWRPYEALTAPESSRINSALRDLREFRPALERLDAGHSLSGPPPETDIALMFSKSGELSHPYSLVSDQESHARYALNAWLQGVTLDRFRTTAPPPFTPCSTANPAWRPEAVREARERFFRQFQNQSVDDESLGRYRPDYLLVPAGFQPDSRIGHWQVLHRSSRWTLWERTAR
jgi:hypothetical protein